MYHGTTAADTTPPNITINFAGNLGDLGGPYWRPPDQVQNLTHHDIVEWRDGYYTNNSRQRESWMYINLTVTDAQSGVDEVWLHWLDETAWVNDSYQFINSGGVYWEFNTSGNISTQEGYNYSFDIWANDTSNNMVIYQWNKTIVVPAEIGGKLAYTRRYVQLNCTPRNIVYVPFYLYEFNYTLNTPFGDKPIKDQWDHDQGPDGSTGDTGVLGEKVPGDYVHARYCAAFYGYWFDDSICIDPFQLDTVYVHMWWNTSDGLTTQGISYKKSRDVLSSLPPFINYSVYKENARSEIAYDGKHYYLETHLLNVSSACHIYTDNNIYELSVYLSGSNPWGITNRSITSFIIFNVPDNSTLNVSHYDTDEDILSDWTELYVTYTNPFLADTDNDGVSDYNEYLNGSDPNNYRHWNNHPHTPEQPDGPTAGLATVDYTYSTSTTDPENDDVFYQWDWNDSTINQWLGPFKSGEPCHTVHNWSTPGLYNVRVRAKDIFDHKSDWSDSLPVAVYACGDCNCDGTIDVADIVYLINYLFIGGSEPQPMLCAGDCNADGAVNIADVVYLINYLFIGGSSPEGCCR
jgi:hypothetical protein